MSILPKQMSFGVFIKSRTLKETNNKNLMSKKIEITVYSILGIAAFLLYAAGNWR